MQDQNKMARDSVFASTLKQACVIVGGEKKLARLLRVPLGDLERWLSGDEEPPRQVFLRAVDVVLESSSPAKKR